ncbi:MAG: hypothetical protein ACKVY0_23465 [Prosthecobacter sp.]|uniref:hypothetical protein n=1 Tax=Prosthecobacter sp. TaxID=1965333 RepID=UPI003904140F
MKTKANTKTTPVLAGVAGEYFVAAELSRRGYIASISLRNTRGIDILATNAAASRSVTIQCKTSQARNIWILSDKSESFHSENHFYVFVALGEPLERPRYHIVPSAAVAKYVRDGHSNWLAKPGRNGQAHVDNPVRNFHDRTNEYLERWDLLDL